MSSIALEAIGSHALIVRDCRFVAGKGARGQAAADRGGERRSNTTTGLPTLGEPGCSNDEAALCNECPRPKGGTVVDRYGSFWHCLTFCFVLFLVKGVGGKSLCGRTGGNGGQPGLAANPGSNGTHGSGGDLGGVPGVGNECCWQPLLSQKDYCLLEDAKDVHGGDGKAGARGSVGARGSFRITASGYEPLKGGKGGKGGDGCGGGGGGGGGGGDDSSPFQSGRCTSYGSGGAGGGAGGCGGDGGEGGGSGGASIGILMVNSDVQLFKVFAKAGVSLVLFR